MQPKLFIWQAFFLYESLQLLYSGLLPWLIKIASHFRFWLNKFSRYQKNTLSCNAVMSYGWSLSPPELGRLGSEPKVYVSQLNIDKCAILRQRKFALVSWSALVRAFLSCPICTLQTLCRYTSKTVSNLQVRLCLFLLLQSKQRKQENKILNLTQ